jgi:hypothetical protein
MMRWLLVCLLVAVGHSVASAAPEHGVRPISGADAVLAIYCDDGDRTSATEPGIILAAWPDGQIVWSADRLHGGTPYREGRIDPDKVADLLARFDQDGLFADKKLNEPDFGPDAGFTTLLIKFGKKQVEMRSWHELYEASGKVVAKRHGLESLNGRRRLDVLRKEPAQYLGFRFVWSEARGKLMDLIPEESSPSTGEAVREADAISWRKPVIKASGIVPQSLEPYPLPAKALDGLTKLAAESDVLVLGELHGTRETPAVAAALLAPLSELGYAALALEIPADERQPLVDWASGKTETVPRFFAKPFADGRGNIQVLALIRTALSAPYHWKLICFDESSQIAEDEAQNAGEADGETPLSSEAGADLYVRREAAMAANLAQERTRLGRDAKVLAICGNFHARTSRRAAAENNGKEPPDDSLSKLWPSFAAALQIGHPAWRVRSVDVVPHGGAFYAMLSSDDAAAKAGIHPIRSKRRLDEAEARALEKQMYDWELNLPHATPATFLAPPAVEIDSD